MEANLPKGSLMNIMLYIQSRIRTISSYYLSSFIYYLYTYERFGVLRALTKALHMSVLFLD